MHFSIPILKSAIFTSTTLHTIIAIVAALALVIEGFISVEVRPTIKNLNILITNLPPEFHGFSIVLVTDIHTGASVGKGKVAEVVKVVNSLDPDIITVVGDLTDGYKGYIGDRAKPLKDLKSRYGNFGTLGNHEYFYENIDNWVKFYKEDLNLTMLINDGVILERNGKQLCLAGLDDFYTEDAKFDGHKMNVTKALQSCPKNISTIILEHQPKGAAKILEELPKIGYHADLILSGHTHGGQMYAVYPMVRLANKYLYGHYIYKETNTQIYVSSGVNYWGPPVKMMASMCEIVYIRILSDLVVK
uniref:Calcineurin-like phosphoesterase domain-containing protein n=1 Tax=Panagrolaimus davidi TaxID=227884 RepID=A0A914PNX5_9BILA